MLDDAQEFRIVKGHKIQKAGNLHDMKRAAWVGVALSGHDLGQMVKADLAVCLDPLAAFLLFDKVKCREIGHRVVTRTFFERDEPIAKNTINEGEEPGLRRAMAANRIERHDSIYAAVCPTVHAASAVDGSLREHHQKAE